MVDAFPVQYDTSVGRVRKYIPDVRQVDGDFIFTDDEIDSFLLDQTLDVLPITTQTVLRAAAWAIIAIANDENLILKKITTEDLMTDGPAVAKQLLASAQELFKRADEADLIIANDEIFISVDYQPYPSRYGYYE